MKYTLICLIAFLLPILVHAQDKVETKSEKNKSVTVYLKDGTRLVGEFDRLTSDTLYFTHPVLGYQKIPQTQLEKFEFGDQQEEAAPQGYKGFLAVETESFYKKYGFGRFEHNRYTLTPNGFGPPKGDIFFRSYMGVVNLVDMGLTDNLSLEFGTVAIIMPGMLLKYRTKIGEKTSIGIKGGFVLTNGALFGDQQTTNSPQFSGYGSAGLSFGTPRENVSLGVGVIGSNGIAVPIYFIGGNKDFSESFALTAELTYFNAGFIQGQRDLFLPMIMPKIYSKRSMWGLGVTTPLTYNGISESWDLETAVPLIFYSRRFGPINP